MWCILKVWQLQRPECLIIIIIVITVTNGTLRYLKLSSQLRLIHNGWQLTPNIFTTDFVLSCKLLQTTANRLSCERQTQDVTHSLHHSWKYLFKHGGIWMRLSNTLPDEALGGCFNLPGNDPTSIHDVLPVDGLGQLCPLFLTRLPEARAGKPEIQKVRAPFLAQEVPEELDAFLIVEQRVKGLRPLQVRWSWWCWSLRLVAQVQVGTARGRRRGGGRMAWRIDHFRRRRREIAQGLGEGVGTGACWLDLVVHIRSLLARNWRPWSIFRKVGWAI